jgi:polyferredoxin
MVASMTLRKPVIMDVIRDRNALYRDVGRQGIENTFSIRIINKHNIDHVYVLSVSGPDGIQLRTENEIFVAGESVATVPVSVTVPHENASGGNVIRFELTSMDNADIKVVEESRFRGPTER